jgi:C4-type Zn-finger protein
MSQTPEPRSNAALSTIKKRKEKRKKEEITSELIIEDPRGRSLVFLSQDSGTQYGHTVR